MAHVQDKRKSGRGWVARVRGPDGRERTKAFKKRVDAERWLTAQEAGKLRGEWVDPRLGRITLNDWMATWWRTTTNLRPSTRSRDESYYRNHTEPRFGAFPLNRITQEDVRSWVADLSAAALAPGTVAKVYATLARPLAAAVDAGRLASTPCRRIPMPRGNGSEPRFLQADQVAALAESVGEFYSPLVMTAAYGGLRWGELGGLRPARIDPLRRTVRVEEQLLEVDGDLSFGPPKTRASQRTVTLPRFLANELGERCALTVVRRSDLLFPTRKGESLRRSNFRRRVWVPATESLGFEGLRFHDLRHTAVALAIAQGAHPKAIQARMGHTSIKTTLDRYGHLFPELDERIADGLDAMHAEVLAGRMRDAR